MTKILLVEDDKSLREIYNVRLRAEGYDIVAAGDGEEALALAIKERPDLIVSDVMMPKISGFDMLDILRSTTETKNVKVIMMTALSSEEQRQRGLSLGADRYLVKSQVGIEDVVRTVQEVLNGTPAPGAGPAPLVTPPANVEHPAPTAPAPAQPVSPGPGSTPAPVAPAQPVAQPSPQPVAVPTAPVASTPAVTPNQPIAAAPATQPAAAPTAPSPAAATVAPIPPTNLPQPTAPFSTPRPGSSGKVIQPLENTDPNQATDFTARMSQELAGAQSIAAIPQPAATPAPASTPVASASSPTPAPIQPSEPTIITPPATPVPTPAPASVAPPAPAADTTATADDNQQPSGLEFEEIARSDTPPAQ